MSNSSKSSTDGRVTPRPRQKIKVHSKDERHALAHLESLQGRVSPEMQTSPIKRPVDSPSHQMKSSFDFNGNLSMDMTSIYMKDYCTTYTFAEPKMN